MPSVLRELHQLPFDYANGEGMDFEPYTEFLSDEDTRRWICAWTGNASLDGTEYRVFGQDGTGGYAAFWCALPNVSILEQPIVFFGSEGELGILATNFSDYLWLLAGGFGPYEAIAYPESERVANPEFTAFATKHAVSDRRTPSEVLSSAHIHFPTFADDVRSMCR